MATKQPLRTRFAPSPNGYLHLGHAYSAILNFNLARENSGQFLLRIEDIDTGRARKEFVDAIFEDLNWLGLTWPTPVVHQSARFSAYRIAADRLTELGVLYPCFATRTQITNAITEANPQTDPDGTPLYPGIYRDMPHIEAQQLIASATPYAMRINMAKAIELADNLLNGADLKFIELNSAGEKREQIARPQRWGDAVIVRKDTPTSYHLSVVIDDEFQNITHVVRGLDLEGATDIHALLQVLLGLPAPAYRHHNLIENDAGLKLSKSSSSTSLRQLRKEGQTPKDIYARLGFNADEAPS